MDVTRSELEAFLVVAQEAVDRDASTKAYDKKGPRLTYEEGPRYIRLVANRNDERSAFGFIDKTNGDVLKTAGWKGPTKNFARGNIRDENKGCGRVRWTGVF
jgi:hypothetical protein